MLHKITLYQHFKHPSSSSIFHAVRATILLCSLLFSFSTAHATNDIELLRNIGRAYDNIPIKEPPSPSAAPVENIPYSEPVDNRTLTPRMKSILEKSSKSLLPPSTTETYDPVSINRGKELSAIAPAEGGTSSKSEMLDLSVDSSRYHITNTNVALEKAFNALSSGQIEIAAQLYKQVIAKDAGSIEALFGLATTYQRSKQYSQAHKLYLDILEIDPEHREALNNFIVLLSEESPEEALAELKKLEVINPELSPIQAQIAMVHVRLEQYDKAILHFRRAIALSPENLSYRYNLAIVLDKLEYYDQAQMLYKQLIKASYDGYQIPGSVRKLEERVQYINSDRSGG